MILYIHGFAGSGMGSKAQAARNFFGDEILAPSLPHMPVLTMDALLQIVSCAS
jgi:predicted esterase YcpF (UPF0227 family)